MDISLTSQLNENIEHHVCCDLVLLKNVINNKEAVGELAKEVQALPFDYKINDLHSLHQTADLNNLVEELQQHTSQFLKILKTQIKDFVDNLYNIKTNENITVTASVYNKGDYLLCHDDRCHDRFIAFVYYLSENWEEKDGGALRFFTHDESLQPVTGQFKAVFQPIFNSLILFKVSDTSHHEVQQVFHDRSRVSINGWFHLDPQKGQKPKPNPPLFSKAELLQFDNYHSIERAEKLVHRSYLCDSTHRDLKAELKYKSSFLAQQFLNEQFYNSCVAELQETNRKWKTMGPANHRNYDVIEVSQNGDELLLSDDLPHIRELIHFCISPFWMKCLNLITGLDFAVFDDKKVPPVCMVEVQRWQQGSYSLLADNNVLRFMPTLELTIFFKVDEEKFIEPIENSEQSVMGGKIVQTTTSSYSPSAHKALYYCKVKRLSGEWDENLFGKQKRLFRKSPHDSATKNRQLQYIKRKKASMELARRFAKEKMKRIMQYRTRGVETELITPKSNSLLLTLNSQTATKFSSYIHLSAADASPQTCYYSVTLTFATTDSS